MNPLSKKNLSIEHIPGIGRHTPKALKFYGIRTIEQFARFTEKEIVALLGNSGKKLLNSAKQLTMQMA
jgi:nucleotidyltransferase/DNA polymerase involved in DNA repair